MWSCLSVPWSLLFCTRIGFIELNVEGEVIACSWDPKIHVLSLFICSFKGRFHISLHHQTYTSDSTSAPPRLIKNSIHQYYRRESCCHHLELLLVITWTTLNQKQTANKAIFTLHTASISNSNNSSATRNRSRSLLPQSFCYYCYCFQNSTLDTSSSRQTTTTPWRLHKGFSDNGFSGVPIYSLALFAWK